MAWFNACSSTPPSIYPPTTRWSRRPTPVDPSKTIHAILPILSFRIGNFRCGRWALTRWSCYRHRWSWWVRPSCAKISSLWLTSCGSFVWSHGRWCSCSCLSALPAFIFPLVRSWTFTIRLSSLTASLSPFLHRVQDTQTLYYEVVLPSPLSAHRILL